MCHFLVKCVLCTAKQKDHLPLRLTSVMVWHKWKSKCWINTLSVVVPCSIHKIALLTVGYHQNAIGLVIQALCNSLQDMLVLQSLTIPINVLTSIVWTGNPLKLLLSLSHLEKTLVWQVVSHQEAVLTARLQGDESITNHTMPALITEQLVITMNSIEVHWMVMTEFVLVLQCTCVKFHRHTLACLCSRLCKLCMYLDESEEMLVALHLPACELKIVFLLPTVMLIGREALMELEAQKKKKDDKWHCEKAPSPCPASRIFMIGEHYCWLIRNALLRKAWRKKWQRWHAQNVCNGDNYSRLEKPEGLQIKMITH